MRKPRAGSRRKTRGATDPTPPPPTSVDQSPTALAPEPSAGPAFDAAPSTGPAFGGAPSTGPAFGGAPPTGPAFDAAPPTGPAFGGAPSPGPGTGSPAARGRSLFESGVAGSGTPGQPPFGTGADDPGTPGRPPGGSGAAGERGRRHRGGGRAGTFLEHRFGLLSLVVVSLLVTYAIAYVTRPTPAPPPPATPMKVAVESVTAVCPGTKGEQVNVYLPGSLNSETMEDGKPYVTTGPGGLEAGYLTRVTRGAGRGLAGVRCTEPAAETWLVGPGPANAEVRLHLTNADKAAALVDVQVYAAEGRVSGDAGIGLEIAPGEHREIDLKTLAPSADVMALSVTTAFGRVAVAARTTLETGGVDWLPPAALPATRMVVPGIPGGGGVRRLLIAAPGETDAVVQIKAVSEEAEYAMKGRETLDVPAGSVVALDVTTGVAGSAAALVLTSPAPIVAGLVSTGTGTRPDVAFTAGTPSLELGSAVARNATGSQLLLTALGDRPGKVRVQVMPGKGTAQEPFDVEIPAGRTRVVKLRAKGDFAVVVTPVSGEVYGGRLVAERSSSGVLLTTQPLSPARTWTLLPPLTDSPRVVLP
ncbi:DUF5719 family protein [Nonomuraea candida]|uniref:DUF5719 family protein n=1 Tax=Nonomuraea candida TaxID=359159 RepID=UPI000A00173F|nr:DUF5719 family protein [Nonomuraea candida]